MTTGYRRLTGALDAARRIASRYAETPPVPRNDAIVAVKRVAAALGVSATAMAVLDAMFGASKKQDWETGSRPIVWPSNQRLCEQVGISLPSLRRRIRELVAAGLVVPVDSPNGKRWGERDDAGRIRLAYGFSLEPLAVRYQEFRELAARIAAQRERIAEWRREATILRRKIEAVIEAGEAEELPIDWEGYADALQSIVDRYPRRPVSLCMDEESERLRLLCKELRALDGMAEEAWRDAVVPKEVTPSGATRESHSQTTTANHPVESNTERNAADAASVEKSDASGGPSMKAGGEAGASQPESRAFHEPEMVSVELVMAACPQIRDYTSGTVRTWADLFAAASRVRPWLGISEAAWKDACSVLGEPTAAAAVCTILQKSSDGRVKSAGGYLRGMVEKARNQELRLARTLYGLANGPKPGEARRLL